MILTKDILAEFKSITNYDVEKYFINAVAFFSFAYNKMVDYYSGKVKEIDKGSFTQLDILENETRDLFSIYQSLSNRLANAKWWVLLEAIEEIDSRLQTARNINKWSKSSLTKVAYDPSVQVSYVMKPKQTLERIAQDVLQKANPSDDWRDIALHNHLEEEDYSVGGGTQLQLSFPQVGRSVTIQSVVDVMVDKNIYGKDIDRSIAFDLVEEDLKVLSPDKTIFQSAEILANLKQNDNPDYPTDGLQSSITAGSNRSSLNFPIISRQMSNSFSTDDSFKNFTIQSIKFEGTGLYIDFSVNTRLNESIVNQTIV